jgi:hypothetical protein
MLSSSIMGHSRNVTSELKKLKVDVRNKVRAIESSDEAKAIQILNSLRKNSSVGELIQIEQTIRTMNKDNASLPELFPSTPQTTESFKRLYLLLIEKQLKYLNFITKNNLKSLKNHFILIRDLNKSILAKEYEKSDCILGQIIEEHGYSHLLLRKTILISNSANDIVKLPNVDNILALSGVEYNNSLVSSLMHCFQEEQDFLSIKKSIMGTFDHGDWNKYTRDIIRLAFHPHAKDMNEFNELIQSNLQSSLIDALLIIKVNKRFLPNDVYKFLDEIMVFVESNSIPIDELAEFYVDIEDAESLFYQQSGAWLENDDIVSYRQLQDTFYDSRDSEYISIDKDLIEIISSWVNSKNLNELCSNQFCTSHSFNNLKKIESLGTITRSSVFNFLIYILEGKSNISEEQLVDLMGKTSGLARTIDIKYIKILAQLLDSEISQIILYLLIAKKSKNELDSHKLRRLLQTLVIRDHEGQISTFVSAMSKVSSVISEYSYDVFTEDFIAQLSHIIKSSQEITETRAKLHEWMGDHTGETLYKDRARSILIDHQINLVKDEIDDNRIYVDTARFTEWIQDNKLNDLQSLVLILEHNDGLSTTDDAQLFDIINKCYFEFCSSKYFGIASYLGRRIRHGTFKGHLYSDVISIEANYEFLKDDPLLASKWEQWKHEHGDNVDKMVREKLHIMSKQKKNGFLNPNIDTQNQIKLDLLRSCAKHLLDDYNNNNHVYGSPLIIADFCWRFAEVDLKNMNSYLKGQKQSLINEKLISEIKSASNHYNRIIVRDFSRDLQSVLSDKLTTMYGWFKRPQSVSPKASLGLLYKAVVAEVRHTFREFEPETDIDELNDIEVVGGAYHVIYDAFYVVVFNAAKHGKTNGKVFRDFKVVKNNEHSLIYVVITSELKESSTEEEVNEKLVHGANADIDNAQMHEERSGISKLYNLEKYDAQFQIENVECINREVNIQFSYKLSS